MKISTLVMIMIFCITSLAFGQKDTAKYNYFYKKGVYEFDNKNYNKALEFFTIAKQADPTQWGPNYQTACMWLQKSKYGTDIDIKPLIATIDSVIPLNDTLYIPGTYKILTAEMNRFSKCTGNKANSAADKKEAIDCYCDAYIRLQKIKAMPDGISKLMKCDYKKTVTDLVNNIEGSVNYVKFELNDGKDLPIH